MMQATDDPPRRFTADEVMQMVAAGILDPDDRLELIDGELLPMPPQDPPHASSVERLASRLYRAYAPAYRVRPQLPLAIDACQLPEPDLVVARGGENTFDRRHPTGADTVLVVEVSDTTVRRDLRKAGIYAAGGVPCYWRLDLASRRLEVYSGPRADGSWAL
ncbi:MAG TPA: Uma2 family endonuclease, partial [Kofleriaceae bacterium]|nr:Uma2 family endonuclease [Kofleriaceae bacterium]